MSIIRTLRRRIRALFSKAELDSELNDEMRLHIALETEELIRTGVTPDEAARRARIARAVQLEHVPLEPAPIGERGPRQQQRPRARDDQVGREAATAQRPAATG